MEITLIRHYVRKYDQPCLKEQTYLPPHPLKLPASESRMNRKGGY